MTASSFPRARIGPVRALLAWILMGTVAAVVTPRMRYDGSKARSGGTGDVRREQATRPQGPASLLGGASP